MEDNTADSQKNPIVLKILVIAGLILSILLFAFMGYSFAEDAVASNWASLGSLALYLVLSPVIVICFITSIIGILKLRSAFRAASSVLMVVSIFMSIPSLAMTSARLVSPLFAGSARYAHGTKLIDRQKDFDQEIEDHYADFQKIFQETHVVTDVPCFGYIILDDTYEIKLSNIDPVRSMPLEELRLKLLSKIFEKKVSVSLPSKEQFIAKYIPNTRSGCAEAISNQRGIQRTYGDIPAEVAFDGEIIDLTWVTR
ncbi:MAG: hypothetical protein JWO73_587 [Candidatus Taylorbacteria bacterium]|nr:hypothetical protein [Candidatus Taylorbacteria bacterium]